MGHYYNTHKEQKGMQYIVNVVTDKREIFH